MENIVYSVNLDLRRNMHQVLVMKEDDVNSRIIEAVITDNGKPYDLTNCAVNLKWKKPDGHIVYINSEKLNNSTVRVVCTKQMLVVAGITEAEFEITDSTSVLSTLKFSVSINETVISDADIESSDDFSALHNIVAHVGNDAIHVPSGGTIGQILKLNEDNNASWQDVVSLTNDEYEKLSNIEEGANKTTIAANLTTTTTGYALDATMGKNLQAQISTLNSNISKVGTYYGETRYIMKNAASKAYGADTFTTAFMILSMFDTDNKYFIGLVKFVNGTSYETLAVLHASDGVSAASDATANIHGTYRPVGIGTLAGASAIVLSVS